MLNLPKQRQVCPSLFFQFNSRIPSDLRHGKRLVQACRERAFTSSIKFLLRVTNAKMILLEREVHYFENDEKMPTLTYYFVHHSPSNHKNKYARLTYVTLLEISSSLREKFLNYFVEVTPTNKF